MNKRGAHLEGSQVNIVKYTFEGNPFPATFPIRPQLPAMLRRSATFPLDL